jgi:outer membrane protein OmpA-like peptidoglycan-associated protein
MKVNKITNAFFAILIIGSFAAYGQTQNSKESDKLSGIADSTKTRPVHWCKDEFSIVLGSGMSILHYQPSVGIRNSRIGGMLGFGYTHFFSSHWGLQSGVEAALYSSSLHINNLSDNYEATDLDPYEPATFNFRYRINKYAEQQRLWNVNIPVAMQFQTPVWTIHKYYTSFGFKLGIPVYDRYKSHAESIESYGYYPEWNQVLNEPKMLGFGTFDKHSAQGKLNFGMSYLGTVETGLKWRIGNGVYLYTGVYFDYAFNDVAKKDTRNQRFVDYNSYHNGRFSAVNSALHSQYTTNDNTVGLGYGQYSDHNNAVKSVVDKVSPMAIGVKFRLAFGCPEVKKKKRVKPALIDTLVTPKDEKPSVDLSALYNKMDSLTDALKNLKQPEPVKLPPAIESPKNIQDILYNRRRLYIEEAGIINYNLNVSSLSAEQKLVMDIYVRKLKANPDYRLDIIGHTCDLGSSVLNIKLGLKRAEGAKAYLIEQGIEAHRVSVFTAGKDDPIVANDSEVHRKQNRRLEFGIIQQEQ